VSGLTIAILAYVGVQLAVGVLVSRGVHTEEDYLLAGRRLGPLVAACSVFATWYGAESCVGAAGQIYRHGLSRMSVEPFAYGVALVLVGVLLAVPLWRAGVTTFPDYLRVRFSAGVERMAAILHIPGSLLWAAAQVRAFGQILTAASDIDLGVAITIAAGIAVVYTAMGGLLADVVTDFMQGGVLVLGLLAVTIAVIVQLGGIDGAIAAAQAHPAPEPLDASAWEVAEAWMVPIGGSLVSQEVLARTLASRSPGTARFAAIGGGGAYLLFGMMPVVLGLVGAGLVPGLADGEAVLPAIAREHLHPVLFVVFCGALVSAILSTVDSALLVAGSLLSRNVLYAGRDDVSDKRRLATARAGVVLFGVAAWFLALRSEGVFDLVEQASGFGSAGLLVVLIAGLFTGRGGRHAAMAALVVGVTMWIALRYVADDFGFPYLATLGASALAYVLALPLERARAETAPA
jgi:solute:Na+ symporter, SSS family